MPKKPNIPPKKGPKKPPKKGKGNKPGKFTKPGSKRNSKKNRVTVYLPAVIPGKGPNEEAPPTSYELEYKDALLAVEMEKLAAKGLSNNQIIDALPISRDTFYKRLKEDPYFSYCLYKHRGIAVNEVESALKKAAVGFEYLEQHATPSGKVVTILKAKTPDTAAIKFFLTNRNPEEWQNKVESKLVAAQTMESIKFSIKRREE